VASLTAALYVDEEPDEDEIEKLRSINLLGALEKEIAKEFWDFSRIGHFNLVSTM
jgi:hypothetical protein